MSQYFEMETCFRDPEALIAALMQVDNRNGGTWTKDQIELHGIPADLFDYHGLRRPQKAHIIIRRKHVGGAANDVGFIRAEDGTFKAIISAYDQWHYGKGWLGRLSQRYAVAVLRGQAAKRGMRVVQSQGEDGKIKLQMTVG